MSNIQNNNFYAFISYSRKDIKDAKWIHSSLERFHIPTKLPRPADSEPIPKPLRCFRDINDLDVMPESFVKGIENALASSKYLVVVCSPNSAQSTADGNHYVDWEIQKFIEVHGLDYAKNHILPVIIDGKITNKTAENECLPPSLYNLGKDFLEHNFPILDYGDENTLSKEAKNDFILKILAFLLQVKYSVLNDRYQKAQKKQRQIVLGAAASLLVIFAAISVYAGLGWKRANKNLAFSDYMQANTLLQNKETCKALAYYKRSLDLDKNPLVQQQVYSVIANRSWLIEKDDVTDFGINTWKLQEDICRELNVKAKENSLSFVSENIQSDGVLRSFSKTGKWAVVQRADNSIELVDVFSKNVLYKEKIAVDTEISKYTFSDSENALVYLKSPQKSKSIHDVMVITILNLETMKRNEIRKNSIINEVSISPDGEFLVYSATNSSEYVELISYNIRKDAVQWRKNIKNPQTEIVFSPDTVHFSTSGSAVTGDSELGVIKIHDAYNQDYCVTASVMGGIKKLEYSNDGRRLCAVTNRNEICLINTRDGSDGAERRSFGDNIISVRFTPDDTCIQVVFSETKREFFIQNNNTTERFRPVTEPCIITNALFLNDNAYICLLMAGTSKNCMEIHSLKSESEEDVVIDLANNVAAVDITAFEKSPDESKILLATKDGMIDIYEKTINPSQKTIENADAAHGHDKAKKPIEFTYKYTETIQTDEKYPKLSFVSEKEVLIYGSYLYSDNDNLYTVNIETKEERHFAKDRLVCAYDLIGSRAVYFVTNDFKDNRLYTCDLHTFETVACTIPGEKHIVTSLKTTADEKILLTHTEDLQSSGFYLVDKNGGMLYSRSGLPKNAIVQVNGNGNLIAFAGENGIVDVFDMKTKRKLFTTDTGFENTASKKITKIDFSDDDIILHIAGENVNDKNGFIEVWDMSTSTKLASSNSSFDSKIKGVQKLENSCTVFYDINYVYKTYMDAPKKDLTDELKDEDIYHMLGGWTLNSYSVPELVEKRVETKGRIARWLRDFSDTRPISINSPITKGELIETLSQKSSNIDMVLDLQPDFEPALDDYYYQMGRKEAEYNYKSAYFVDSTVAKNKMDLSWDSIYQKFEWIHSDEAARKLYEFYIDVYVRRHPLSATPLMRKCAFYARLGQIDEAKLAHEKARELEPSNILVFRADMQNSESPEEQKSLFAKEMNLLDKNESATISDICTVFSSYLDTIGIDAHFDELKAAADWGVSALNKRLRQETVKKADVSDIENIAENLLVNVTFFPAGIEYYISWVERLLDGVSQNALHRFKIDENLIFSRIMDCILTNNVAGLDEIYKDFEFSEDIQYENLMMLQNMFWYYRLTHNKLAGSLLDYLLSVDEYSGMNFMASGFLTDMRLFDILGIQDIYDNADRQKILEHSFRYSLEDSITITAVIPGKQADKIGLKAGDKIFYYANYPVTAAYSKFFMNDLHKGELKHDKRTVPIIVQRNGKILSFLAKEGLLGIQL